VVITHAPGNRIGGLPPAAAPVSDTRAPYADGEALILLSIRLGPRVSLSRPPATRWRPISHARDFKRVSSMFYPTSILWRHPC